MTRWVPPLLYGVVLLGGCYYSAVGPGLTWRTAGFAAVLGLLIALDTRDSAPRRRFVARLLLLCAVTLVDVSGLSRVLFVLVPFDGYFVYGPQAAIGLASLCVLGVAAAFTLTVDAWWIREAYLSDLLMFTLGTVLAVTMAAVAVRERQARERIAELSAARERNRLAREIHDSLGHHLTAIGIQLEAAEAFASADPARAARSVANARWSADRALAEVRASVHALTPETPGVTGALEELVRHLDGEGRRVTLTVEGTERRPLPALYRAAQEGVTNACRHSAATVIDVAVHYDEQGAELRVADNGRGIGATPEGRGLRGLRERIHQEAGTVEITSSTTGTELRAVIPW